MLSWPILFRKHSKNKNDGFLHPTIDDCVNVFSVQMVNSEAPPFSTFHNGEKIEKVFFEVKNFATYIKWGLEWTEVIQVAKHLHKKSACNTQEDLHRLHHK